VTSQSFPAFKPKGTLEGWKKMVDFYNTEGMELHQFIVCTGFGSPLMEFIPRVQAAGLHIYSKESGLGKTTAMASAMSIWANPEEMILDDQDTRNFKMNRGEVYKNLPLYFDEVTNTKPEELSQLAYQLTSGRQRGRLSSSVNQERKRGQPWSLLCVTTGNTSFVERISAMKLMAKAEQQRILEMRVTKVHKLARTNEFNDLLANNYGHAGPIYMKAILNDMEGTEKLVKKVQEKIEAKFNLTPENRFWSAYISATLAGGIIASRLGLIPYDMDALLGFSHELVIRNRAEGGDNKIDIDEMRND
jgi:uncharacterized protein (DUF927 family)